jgi:hypothetical protein
MQAASSQLAQPHGCLGVSAGVGFALRLLQATLFAQWGAHGAQLRSLQIR